MSKTSDSKKGRFNGRGHLFTSESVTMGHPDKVADQISDAILDAVLAQDPNSRVACETLVATGMAVIAGEITTAAEVSIPDIVRSTIKKIGYTDPAIGFDADNCAVLVALGKQSPDISQGVTEGKGLHKEQGAGDQGIMFGFACKETPGLMPMPIYLAHKLTERLAKMRQSGKMPWLRPDGKSQVTVEYGDDGKPKRIHTVVISTQHTEDISYREIKKQVIENIILPVLPAKLVDKKLICHVNPTGRFVTGGPKGDSGLTGRKIIVDTYGGRGSHGGGAFSGKDPSKVDRSASYMARYLAKNVVAAGLAKRCEVQLAYAIGVAEPISVSLDCFGTAGVDEKRIEQALIELVDMRPDAIIRHFNLRRPIYRQIANYGHFGRVELGLPWEATDLAAKLKSAAT